MNNPCTSGFRLPTADEWQKEIDSWSSHDAAGAFASPLKLVMAGERSAIDGSVSGEGGDGYWSSTISSDFSDKPAAFLAFDGVIGGGIYLRTRSAGYSVRCIKD